YPAYRRLGWVDDRDADLTADVRPEAPHAGASQDEGLRAIGPQTLSNGDDSLDRLRHIGKIEAGVGRNVAYQPMLQSVVTDHTQMARNRPLADRDDPE